MRIDDFMPQWDFNEYHQTMVAAEPETIYKAVRKVELGRSPLVRPLLLLRELPMRLFVRDYESTGLAGTLDDMFELGFIKLADQPPDELVFGLAGRFWVLSPKLHELTPREFIAFDQPGQAKAAGNLHIRRLGQNTCRLSTETRIQCLDPKAKRQFRRYWTMIRPFSGLIRIEWLRLIKREAEKRV